MRRRRRGRARPRAIMVACALGLAAAPLAAGQEDSGADGTRRFASGQAGSLPSDPADRTGTYFDHPRLRALIYDLEEGPVGQVRVEAALEGTDFSIEDLVRVRFLRREDGRFFIGFNYFDLEDMRAIHRVAEAHVPALVHGYLARRDEFAEIFSLYPVESVPDDLLAFVLIAGFSLNWDGLKVTEAGGWRRPSLVTGREVSGERWQYSFWASELDPEYSTRGFFSASTTFPGGPFNYLENPVDFSFSSFGDPHSDPRMTFPDLLYLPGEAMSEAVREIAGRIGLAERRALGRAFRNALGLELGRSVAAILFELRRSPRSGQELMTIVREEDLTGLADVLDLLEETRYVEERDGRYYLLVPVLDYADARMVGDALSLSREILREWLSKHYRPIRADLSDLTSLQHGVAFESLFTEIWHNFFGLATKRLVESGFIADPYGHHIPYPASFPTLWRMSLYEFVPG